MRCMLVFVCRISVASAKSSSPAVNVGAPLPLRMRLSLAATASCLVFIALLGLSFKLPLTWLRPERRPTAGRASDGERQGVFLAPGQRHEERVVRVLAVASVVRCVVSLA